MRQGKVDRFQPARQVIALGTVALLCGGCTSSPQTVVRPSSRATPGSSPSSSATSAATVACTIGTRPSPRFGAAMAYDAARKNIVLFSGVRGDGSPPMADTWTFDGCHWKQLAPATSPPGRSFGAMTYDSEHGVVVLFGGGAANSDPGRSDTWTWDGSAWTQRQPNAHPPVMAHALLEYDRADRVVVLIGQALTADATVVWTWNGSTWQPKHPANSPPGRSGPGAAYGVRGGILYFGGQPGEAGALNDSWVWDGAEWMELHPPSSPAGGYARMARDDARANVVLLEADGTWIWNGSTWSAVAGRPFPPFEYFRSIAYDAATGQVVLFGGKSTQTNVGTDEIWTWDGSNWSRR